MQCTRRYLVALAVWTVGLFGFLALAGAGSGGTPWSWASRLPALAGFALILACLPAGIRVGPEVLASPRAFARDGAKVTALALTVCVLAFAVVQYVAPAALAGGRAGGGDGQEPRELSLPQLRGRLGPIVGAAEAAGESDLEAWHAANALAFEHERRLAHGTLPFFLTWVGALAGFWSARVLRPQLRVAQLLALGLFVVVSMYLGGENGYELVAARAAGPAYFAAWFIVLVPALLGVGLGWPTLVVVFAGDGPPGEGG